MELLKRLAFALLTALVLTSCSKPGMNCFTNPGKTVMQIRQLPEFKVLSMHDNVDVVLVKSQINQVEVYSGEHTISDIITEVDEKGHLHIRNNSYCRLLKQRERINRVTLLYRSLDTIEYRSVGTLTTMDAAGESTWMNPDSLVLDIFEGAGDSIRLRIETPKARIQYRYGTTPVKILGTANVAFFYHAGYGILDGWDLQSAFSYLETRSPNNLYVRADLELEATINGEGNIYYHGQVSDAYVRQFLKGFGNGRAERRSSRP
ncbi:MAG TPA: DUF2807 domain-containing protein [Bacteroidales bacterium]|nr:DUF2807 domain-containing protein [Bacteroidales bacterium]